MLADLRDGTLVTRCCFDFGEFDSLAKLRFKSLVKYIVDGGAYIGASSIRLAALFRDATILAVEPNYENFEILTRNVEHIPRIIPIHAALADDDGFVEMYNNFGRHWGITTLHLSTNAVSERVISYSLDSLIAKYLKEGYVDILKLDVEGAELSIFHGAKRWIQNIGALIVETHYFLRPGCTRAFFECTEGFVDVYIDGEKFLCYNNAYVAESPG